MAVGRLEDVVVLFVFLGLSLVISALLARQAERAGAAEARERDPNGHKTPGSARMTQGRVVHARLARAPK